MIGTVLGHYRIEEELSSGGMGAVYLARHEVLERPFAIKLLRPELTTSDEMLQRFVNEAKAASAIRHPSIIEVFDFGQTADGQAYLVMEFLDGEPLSARLASAGKLSERDAARIVRSIAGALAAAHAKGIIHRDLKPDNIFLVADPDVGERAKVLDFGIAKLAESQTHHTMTGALMGTPLYMAPEQARSAGTIDARADLYSLGCIFYELVTGKPPLTGVGAGEIIALHMFTAPEPPSSLAPISREVESIILRLLEKEPVDRFASATELSDALGALIGPTTALPVATPMVTGTRAAVGASPSLISPARPPRNRMPLVAAGLTLAIAAIAALVILLGARSSTRANTPPPRPAPPIEPAPAPAPVPVAPPPAPVPSKQPVNPAPAPRPHAPPKKSHETTGKGSPIETSI